MVVECDALAANWRLGVVVKYEALGDKWRVKYRTASMQFAEEEITRQGGSMDVQSYLKTWLGSVKIPGGVRLTIDVDPISFF